jgi:hypothetical protein
VREGQGDAVGVVMECRCRLNIDGAVSWVKVFPERYKYRIYRSGNQSRLSFLPYEAMKS